LKDNRKGSIQQDFPKIKILNLLLKDLPSFDGSVSKIFDPGWVSHLWFGSEFEKFPPKNPKFSIFSLLGQKKSHWVRLKST